MQSINMKKVNCPKAIFIMGLPGTGKTYLANELSKSIAATHISSDAIRKIIKKRGQYQQDDKQEVYREMQKQMEAILEKNEAVILDATFYQQKVRDEFQSLAKQFTKDIFWILTTADEAIIKTRVSKKRPDSEADFKVYQLIKNQFEPIQSEYLEIKTDELPLKENIEIVKKYCKIVT